MGVEISRTGRPVSARPDLDDRNEPLILDLGPAEGFPPRKLVQAGEKIIAVFRTPSEWYAIEDRCSHRAGPLSEGRLEVREGKATIQCPWHEAKFDLKTGEVLCGPARRAQKTHSVVEKNGRVLLEITP